MHIRPDHIHCRARVRIHQERPYDFDEKTGLWVFRTIAEDEVWNIVTNLGRAQLHSYCYGTSPRTNGFNYIALSNDSTTPSVNDTTLTAELTTNGLGRAQGSVTLPVGLSIQTIISRTFTYTGVSSQAIQKSALFDASAGGIMNHEVQFATRTLQPNDTITMTFTINLG